MLNGVNSMNTRKFLVYFILMLLVTAMALPAQIVLAAGAPSRLRFTTSPQAIQTGSPSMVITVQARDTAGSPATAVTAINVRLTSSATTGKFDTSAKGPFNGSITAVTIPAGANSVSFYYKDSAIGKPTLTASSVGLEAGTQQWTIFRPVNKFTAKGAALAKEKLSARKAAFARETAAGMKTPGVTRTFAGINPATAKNSPLSSAGDRPTLAAPAPLAIPHYYGPFANYANSPLPQLSASNTIIPGTGMRKFVDSLPGLGPSAANNLGQYIPVAVPDKTTYPGNDYYEIELRQYTEKMHSDLPATKLRGYVQVRNGVDVAPIHYLGPLIIAEKNRAVRVKFTNKLPTGVGGDLFIPTDTTVMGAGTGPNGGTDLYTQNRAGIHLHGNDTVWISDGTPHQWVTPAGEITPYQRGASTMDVPDMPNPGPGATTLYWTNQQSSRLMFYHDHAYGITRLNVLAGEAAGYLLGEPIERSLISAGVIPATQIPLVIQDKTFVPDNGAAGGQLAATDPTWDVTKYGGFGQLWYPHVYMPNENPWDISGMNAFGRWPYGPWFYPPTTDITYPPIPNPYYDPVNAPWEGALMPATPNPSMPGEAFLDTPMVNGTAYPYVTLDPKTYRFRVLNAANDRFFNLQLYESSSPTNGIVSSITITNGGSKYATPPTVTITRAPGDITGVGATAVAEIDSVTGAVIAITMETVGSQYTAAPIVTLSAPGVAGGITATATAILYTGTTEVGMIPAANYPGYPTDWPRDGRMGGVPNPALMGPSMIQIATESGFLPAAVVLPNRPIDWNLDPTTFDMGNVNKGTLILGPAERADIIVDFSQYAGKTIILYNDSPAPFPALDPRYDYYTSNPDQTTAGGTPSTQPGYGPNTRTVMQIRVRAIAPSAPYKVNTLKAALPAAFAQSQDRIIVPGSAYNAAYRASFPVDPYVRIHDTSKTFTPIGSATPITVPFELKAIHDEMSGVFDGEYGRLSSTLGLAVPNVAALQQQFLPFGFASPPVEIVKGSVYGTPVGSANDGTQIWKISHNGVDTHTVHTHLFSVQVINRVAWDGIIRPPDPNELGWKETFRANPLQDTIVALRPYLPTNIPFQVPNSIRPLDLTKPLGATLPGPSGAATFTDPAGNPVTVVNHLVNFGWEYVYHCHLLAHEEMDMMHAVSFGVPPAAASNLAIQKIASPRQIRLTWRDNSANETAWVVQRATSAGGPWTTIATPTTTTAAATGGTVTYNDTTTTVGTTYYYRVLARNVVGDTATYAGSTGFPKLTLDSTASVAVSVTA
jgi:FtsP/CotA-like multicopper oxidase with cupredoxin domain